MKMADSSGEESPPNSPSRSLNSPGKDMKTPERAKKGTAVAMIAQLMDTMSSFQKTIEAQQGLRNRPETSEPSTSGTSKRHAKEDEQRRESDAGSEQNGGSEEHEEDNDDGSESGEVYDSSDEDLFAALAGDYKEADQSSPPVSESLAKLVTDQLKVKITEDHEKSLFQEYLQPANIPLMATPKLNPEIAKKISRSSLAIDQKLVNSSDKIVQSLLVNTQLAERLGLLKQKVLGETRQEIKEIAKLSTDALQAGAIALQVTSQRRRERIKKDLSPAYQELCEPPEEESTWLFGDNLGEKIKELASNKGLSQQLGLEKKPSRERVPAHHFLGKSRFQPYGNRPRYNPQQYGHQSSDRRPTQSRSPRKTRGTGKGRGGTRSRHHSH